jgi:hypothetical protein
VGLGAGVIQEAAAKTDSLVAFNLAQSSASCFISGQEGKLPVLKKIIWFPDGEDKQLGGRDCAMNVAQQATAFQLLGEVRELETLIGFSFIATGFGSRFY